MAASSPWFRLTSRTVPTHIVPGGEGTIIVQAVNLGNATSASGPGEDGIPGTKDDITTIPYVLADSLPAGLSLQSVQFLAPPPPAFEAEKPDNIDLGPEGEYGFFEYCKTTASSVTCSAEDALIGPEAPALFAGPVLPYNFLEMRLKVKDEGATSGSLNEIQASGGGAQARSSKPPVQISPAPAGFGIEEFTLGPEDEGGEADTHAGSHPYQLTNTLSFNRDSTNPLQPPAPPRDLHFKLPPGQIGNATAVAQCNATDFAHVKRGGRANSCAGNTAIGVAVVTAAINPGEETVFTVPIFNLTPATGEPARFGFEVLKNPVILDTSLRSGPGEDYGVTVNVSNIPQLVNFISGTFTFWGAPADPSHNESRGWGCLLGGTYQSDAGQECELSHDPHPAGFLTLPTNCQTPFDPSVEGDSWPIKATPQAAAESLSFLPIDYQLQDSAGNPLSLTGCNQLAFAPAISAEPTAQSASSPSGLDFNMNVRR